MLKVFPIDLIRVIFENHLAKNNGKDFYDDSQIKFATFYEHLASDEEVIRYKETYQELIGQQNHQNDIGVGIIATTDTPSIINVRKTYASSFEWGAFVRVNLENRDTMLETLYDMFGALKGRKFEVAIYNSLDEKAHLIPKMQVLGVVGETIVNNTPSVSANDFIGFVDTIGKTLTQAVEERIEELCGTGGLGFTFNVQSGEDLFIETRRIIPDMQIDNKVLRQIKLTEVDGVRTYEVVSEFGTYEKLKVDLSFDDIKMSEPYTLNKDEYCELTFSGQSTVATHNVVFGNDIVRVGLKRNSVKANQDITYTDNYEWLDPISVEPELNANSISSQVRSGFFLQQEHNDSISIQRDYEFIYDSESALLNALFKYAKYGVRGTDTDKIIISPNMVFKVCEIESCFGKVEKHERLFKLIDNVKTPKGEDDIITIQVSMSMVEE